jgi:hypothetical protein
MIQSEFETQYHWLYGLREYFQHIGKGERYEELFKAIYQGNWYRKRDLLVELLNSKNDTDQKHIKSWMNVLLHEHLEDVELKPQMMATMIRHFMGPDDHMMGGIVSFISYFGDGPGKHLFRVPPDLNDFLSRGQVRSKLWMVNELKNILEDDKLGNVVMIGGWYNFLAHFLFNQFAVNKLYSIDIDERVADPSKRMYPYQVKKGQFVPLTYDINDLDWQHKTLRRYDRSQQRHVSIDSFECVINTSCEHMDNAWFENLPQGTFVVLQTNDYFSNTQHVNCCQDLENTIEKYPMTHLMYQGELDTHLYKRFMLIGVK